MVQRSAESKNPVPKNAFKASQVAQENQIKIPELQIKRPIQINHFKYFIFPQIHSIKSPYLISYAQNRTILNRHK